MAEQEPHTWRKTKLWQELKSRDEEPAPKLRHLMKDTLPKVERVLNKGDTMPGNFTLHDGDHSWRVAEGMADLSGEELLGEMSSHDLGLLLFSAYLHDIGMTPPMGKVKGNYELLLSGDPGKMSAAEVEELQEWLDEGWDGIVPPLATKRPSREDLRLANQIIAGYVRHRHNEWSEEWIRKFFEHRETPYPRWVDHLVRLCRSHHQDIDELAGREFQPRLVDSPSNVLHLRYCACLLRVADILDFDPERTPQILFEHKDVEEISAIFWQKDREISFRKEGDHLQLNAEPEDALTHHAIVETVAAVDRELRLCRQLDEETDFQHQPGSRKPLPHRWTLDPAITAIVEPADGAYTYVDGTFRPDAQRLLELVGGIALYRTPMAAIRELLQNAFDAVREQMARERLRKRYPGSTKSRDAVAANHEVSLTLTSTKSGLKLTCADSGVGMSRGIISDRFLVGGTTAGHDLRRLERECEAHGFSLGRTAQFGIGVLSYFLVADNLVLHTCRSKEGGNEDGTGWTFSSLGLTDFGELKRNEECPVGTTVEFDIDLDGGKKAKVEFAWALAEYVDDMVRRAPCSFSFSAPEFDLAEIEFDGWPDREADVRETYAEDLGTEEAEALVLHSYSGDLPDNLGTFRIHLGHFETDAGPSLAYLKVVPAGPKRYEIKGEAKLEGAQIGTLLDESWNGMNITSAADYDLPQSNAYIEIDWASNDAGQLMVSREAFSPSKSAVEAVGFVGETAEELLRELVEEHIDSPMALLNLLQLDEGGQKFEAPPAPYWRRDEGNAMDAKWYFAPLVPPIVDRRPLENSDGLSWRGKPVLVPAVLELRPPEGGRGAWNWYGHSKPQRIGAVKTDSGVEPVAIWEQVKSYDASADTPRRATARFPPEWEALAGVSILESRRPTVWNRDHPLLRAVDSDSWKWAQATFPFDRTQMFPTPEERVESMDPRPHLGEFLESDPDSEGRVAAWMLMCLQGREEIWDRLAEHSPQVLLEAWNRVDGLEQLGKILFYRGATLGERSVNVITSSTWEVHREEEADREFARQLELPGENWLLTLPAPRL